MLSGNEVEKLKSLRGKLAVLCPETDGLQAKHRIRYRPHGKTQKEKQDDIVSIEIDISLPAVCKGQRYSSQKLSRLISLIYQIQGFSSETVYKILSNKRFRNRNT